MSDIRERVRNLFKDLLGSERHGKALESCVYNVVCETSRHAKFWENPHFRKAYSVKARSMMFNLNNPETPQLKRDLMTATDIEPFRRLVRMSHQQMHPALWQPYIDEAARKACKGLETETAPEGQLQCSKCKSWRCQFQLLQTRSSDEPATAFCFCNDCGKRWKMAA